MRSTLTLLALLVGALPAYALTLLTHGKTAVLRDRPELALPDAVVQTLVAKTIPDLCEDVPWPWLLPGEGSSAEPPHRRRT